MTHRLKILLTALTMAAIHSVASDGDNFRETGRFGLLGALTEDQWKAGVVYQAEKWETSILGHMGIDSDKQTTDVHIILKVGYRMNLGSFNYLSFGGEYGVHPGSKDTGVKIGGAYNFGPYLALQRYFSGSNLMLNLWVNPISYTHDLSNNGSGGVSTANMIHFFQTGGFGIAYMF